MLEDDQKHILIVEDDLEICRLLDMFLRSKGYQISLSNNGIDGLSDIIRLQPDIVVLDIMMPGMNGIEVCKQSRQTYTGPIIMLTARVEEIDHLIGFDVGADDYVTKPFKPKELMARV
ncbi:MAG: response regulator, partial [Moritella sp.]|uniref:response regulator transcription factor n=1 Tax=Moritella sp. TaxID=78556 RepID=UPI001D3799D3